MVFFCFGLLVVFLAAFWILINAVACVKTVFDFMLPEGRWCLGFYQNARNTGDVSVLFTLQ